MDSADAYDDMMLRAAEEQGDTYEQEQPNSECELCGRFFTEDEIFVCKGCGEIYGCKNCMYYHPDCMEYFCDEECRREYERKQRNERPGFEGVFDG